MADHPGTGHETQNHAVQRIHFPCEPEVIKEVLNVMLDLARSEMTLPVMPHEMEFTSEVAGRPVFMDAGEIVEAVTPDMFFDNLETGRATLFQEQLP